MSTLVARRRAAWVPAVARRMADANGFGHYARLAERLPQWLRQHGLRLTLDYLQMLAGGRNAQADTATPARARAADALLKDWASSPADQGDFCLAQGLLNLGTEHPGAAEWLRLLQLAVADAQALRHLCKLAEADLKLQRNWSGAHGLGQPAKAWPPLPEHPSVRHGSCAHTGLAWRFAGRVPFDTLGDQATYRTTQVTAVVVSAASELANVHRKAYSCRYFHRKKWLEAQQATHGTRLLSLRLRSHLFTALGERGVWETNALLHPVTGMPFIAASQIKNLVRRTMVARIARLPPERRPAFEYLLNDLLGQDAEHGAGGLLVIHDAWWVPHSATTPVVGDVDNSHHAAYYQGLPGHALARPQDSPQPHPQLAVRGELLFALGVQPTAGPQGPAMVQRCLRWLGQALAEHGVGARSFAAGAGRFEPASTAVDTHGQ